MSAILEDPSDWRSFFPDPSAHLTPAQDAIDLEVFEWYSDGNVQPQRLPPLKTANELIDLDNDVDSTCSLRVVLATQEPSKRREDAHRKPPYQAIYRHYSFPTCWIVERVQSATCSFGTQQNAEDANVNVSWLRLTCKDVQKRKTKQIGKWHMYEIVDGDDRVRRGGSQSSSTWWHLDALVHTRIRQDGSKCATLLCFSKRPDLEARFEHLLSCKKWTDAVDEPYLLFSILLEKWFVILDEVSWNLADVFRPVEELTFERADVCQPQQQEQQQQDKNNNESFRLDFAGLHNLSKHCSYLLEAAEAAILVLDQLSTSLPTPTTPFSTATLTSLNYRRTTFRSTQLRLRSLQSRMTNLLALSFNLVTQDDSQTMKTDSKAMKAIAVLTLIFLPLTGIASMFSTPFFNVDFETKRQWLQVAESFWVFWVITAPSTVLIFGAWAAWYYRGRIKLTVGAVVKGWKRRGEAHKGADEEAVVSRQPREPALSSRTMELRKTLFFRSREMSSAN